MGSQTPDLATRLARLSRSKCRDPGLGLGPNSGKIHIRTEVRDGADGPVAKRGLTTRCEPNSPPDRGADRARPAPEEEPTRKGTWHARLDRAGVEFAAAPAAAGRRAVRGRDVRLRCDPLYAPPMPELAAPMAAAPGSPPPGPSRLLRSAPALSRLGAGA